MSAKPAESAAAKIASVTKAEAGYGLRFVSRESVRILLAFLAIVLPLLGFAALAEELREDGVFFFDAPVMLARPLLRQRRSLPSSCRTVIARSLKLTM